MAMRRDSDGQGAKVADRVVPLDRARTFITLLVVFYHSVINYTYYGIGGDRMRWIGFDGVVLFCDSFFMPCMFLISGLFVHGSLARRGAGNYLASRLWRIGVPYLVSILVIMPLAYYRYYLGQFDFAEFYWHLIRVGTWPVGSAWFLLVLLALDAAAALVWATAPQIIESLGRGADRLHRRPMSAFALFVAFSIIIYLPLRLTFGDSAWFTAGRYPIVIQTSRILLYAGYFLCGLAAGAAGLREAFLAEGGSSAKRWRVWLGFALAFYGAIVVLVYVHHSGLIALRSPPLWWHTAYGVAFAAFCASMTFSVPAIFLHFVRSRLWPLDAMQRQAYGIYLLHFIPLLWLQYLLSYPPLPAFVKFAIVFVVTLSTSWAAAAALRKISVVAKMIS
ncbi:MAG TPA: acyltransferase [Bradyrhizobium sp.]|uniref:acyltransferase n=1 Tax=Bradyrhizobium sp. TaxID=376 RepID=UPI002BA383B3|nr:acyltransferase [Bradyrhizobium sp.]HLZ00808.1 acyltransferase [Bradyrhizobium sp.]